MFSTVPLYLSSNKSLGKPFIVPTITANPNDSAKAPTLKNPLKARYVKVVATNFGKCPSWHLGSGGDTWIFLDEISIN